jgi:hypothetical protein
VLGSDERLVYVLDPQDGYRVVPRGEFLEQWAELTHEFLPEAGGSVAAFAPYRVSTEITLSDVPGVSALGAADAAGELAAEGAGVTRAP